MGGADTEEKQEQHTSWVRDSVLHPHYLASPIHNEHDALDSNRMGCIGHKAELHHSEIGQGFIPPLLRHTHTKQHHPIIDIRVRYFLSNVLDFMKLY